MIKQYACSLYKRLLSEGRLFFDDRARTFIINRTKKTFQEYKSCQDQERIKHKLKEARRYLHLIEQANRGNKKKAFKILQDAYGRTGKTRHLLLAPYLKPLPFNTPAFVPHVPRTTPPPTLSPALAVLIRQDLRKAIEPTLPVPLYKPLHPGRKANLLWRYRSLLMERIQLPLPLEILHELERSIDPRCLSTGGAPNWDTLYFHHHPDLAHLSPTAKLVPRATWQRQLALGPSPFSFTKSIASYLPPEPETMTTARPYTERQKRRFYQRLLTEVPLINHFDGTDMWRTDFSLSRSRLAIGKKMVVIEIPKEVQEAMSNGTKGKKKKDKKKDKMVDK